MMEECLMENTTTFSTTLGISMTCMMTSIHTTMEVNLAYDIGQYDDKGPHDDEKPNEGLDNEGSNKQRIRRRQIRQQ